jgi:DNA-binding winged helix-turn-helix (wHTH) protein
MTVQSRESLNLLYFFDKFALDPDRRELRCGAASVAMEPQAFDLLLHLIRHREHVVSRDELIAQIWGGRIVSESALSTRINAVRSAIGDSGSEQRLIKTLPRKGVRFVGEVREGREPCEAPSAVPSEQGSLEATDEHLANGGQSSLQVLSADLIDGQAQALSAVAPAPAEIHRVGVRRATLAVVTALGFLGFVALVWGHFAQTAQAERARADVERAQKLTDIAQQINMTSREDYQAVRELAQWAVDLDPHNATALSRLTFAIVTGVLNHWSSDIVADLHAADLTLAAAAHVAPESMMVRGAQCHILRAMRQFESAIQVCGELEKNFPKYAFVHKEIGYNRLMLGQLDEALAEFVEADRIDPNSRLRWTWNQGMGLVYLMRGQDQEAIERLSRAALEAPNAGHPAAFLASAYALSGRKQEARDALDHYLKLWPKTSLDNFGPMVGTAAFNNSMERVREGLRLAGLPE